MAHIDISKFKLRFLIECMPRNATRWRSKRSLQMGSSWWMEGLVTQLQVNASAVVNVVVVCAYAVDAALEIKLPDLVKDRV